MDHAALGPVSGPRSVLIVGSGADSMPQWEKSGYAVTRLDIEPRTNPDVLASMTDMGPIGPFGVVFCSHALEHLYPHEVPVALSEFRRVLCPRGVAVVIVPDLEGVPATDDVLPGIGVSGLHMYYGDASQIAEFPHMAHHCGFVESTLKGAMQAAGFEVRAVRGQYNLIGIGVKA